MVWNTISANFSSSISFWGIVRRDRYRMKIGVTFTKSFKLKWDVACILHYFVVVVWILHTNASHPNSSHSRERKPTEWKNCCGFVILSHFLAGTSTFSRIFYWISILCLYAHFSRWLCTHSLSSPSHFILFDFLFSFNIIYNIYPLRFVVVLAFYDYDCYCNVWRVECIQIRFQEVPRCICSFALVFFFFSSSRFYGKTSESEKHTNTHTHIHPDSCVHQRSNAIAICLRNWMKSE